MGELPYVFPLDWSLDVRSVDSEFDSVYEAVYEAVVDPAAAVEPASVAVYPLAAVDPASHSVGSVDYAVASSVYSVDPAIDSGYLYKDPAEEAIVTVPDRYLAFDVLDRDPDSEVCDRVRDCKERDPKA